MKHYSQTFEKILLGFVGYPSKLKVRPELSQDPRPGKPTRVLIGVNCHPEDNSRIIGKEARMIIALQDLCRWINKKDSSIALWISVADNPNRNGQPTVGKIVAQWDPPMIEKARALMMEIMEASFDGKLIEITHSEVGGHHVYRIKTEEQIPQNLLWAIQRIFSTWGGSNGAFLEIQNDYNAI
jgi:predicted RNA-binding protein YlqC (UPF0109 family)